MAYSNSLEFLKMIKEVGSAQLEKQDVSARQSVPAKQTVPARESVSARQSVPVRQTVPARQPVTARQSVSARQTVSVRQTVPARQTVSVRQRVPQRIFLDREIKNVDSQSKIAVIDTETNWYNEVMSIGIALADADTFKCIDAKYFVIDPECRKGGMYSNVLNIVEKLTTSIVTRQKAMEDICRYFKEHCVSSIYAYNAKFDYGHLEELSDFEWFDIMRIAAYRQFNSFIPPTSEFCKSGRLKKGYSVENILRMISGDSNYCETHNAVYDAMDELKIMELLGHELNSYDCAKIN